MGIIEFAAVEMQSNGTQSNLLDTMVNFDTDLAPIGIDNICMKRIFIRFEDLENPMVKSDRAIKYLADQVIQE